MTFSVMLALLMSSVSKNIFGTCMQVRNAAMLEAVQEFLDYTC